MIEFSKHIKEKENKRVNRRKKKNSNAKGIEVVFFMHSIGCV